MLLSAVCVLVVAQSSSEIPEGLTNNPVYPAIIGKLKESANAMKQYFRYLRTSRDPAIRFCAIFVPLLVSSVTLIW